MKVVLIIYVIIYVINYTIYFTFESMIFRSYHNWCPKGAIKIKRIIMKSQEFKHRPSKEVVYHSDGGIPTFVSRRFHNH